jgi:hypothetical protein
MPVADVSLHPPDLCDILQSFLQPTPVKEPEPAKKKTPAKAAAKTPAKGAAKGKEAPKSAKKSTGKAAKGGDDGEGDEAVPPPAKRRAGAKGDEEPKATGGRKPKELKPYDLIEAAMRAYKWWEVGAPTLVLPPADFWGIF